MYFSPGQLLIDSFAVPGSPNSGLDAPQVVGISCPVAHTLCRAMLGQVVQRMHALLLAHLQRFTFSQTGALRLKHDVSEYSGAVRGMGGGEEALETELKAMVSILIISPASLLGVVDGSLA